MNKDNIFKIGIGSWKVDPDNFEEDPEIKNNLNLIFQGFDGLKDYLHKQNQHSCRPKRTFLDNK